jgi:hypothetical protein
MCGIIPTIFKKGKIMVFTNRKSVKAPIEPKEELLEVSVKESEGVEDDTFIDFLSPKNDSSKIHGDLYQGELLKKSAHQMTLKTLNAIKIVSPIITALIKSQKTQNDEEFLSMNFKKMVLEISTVAEQICIDIGVDPKKERNTWVRNVLERNLAEFYKEGFLNNKEDSLDVVKKLVPAIMDFSIDCAEKEPFEEISATSLIQLANIKAIMPIVTESVTYFDLYRKVENDVEHILTKLHIAAANATKVLADDYANEKNRAQLYYLLMQEAGVLYASCWKAESKRILDIISNNSERIVQETEKFKANGGFPLKKIDDEFQVFFNRFVVISQKLTVATSKAALINKLKK